VGTKFSQPMTALSRKIDQYYEMAGLARQDGDKADEAKWLKKIKDLSNGQEPDQAD
jgi:hypothetical protein